LTKLRTAPEGTRARVLATDTQIDQAIARARREEEGNIRVINATYRVRGDHVVLGLSTGVEVAIPRVLLQGLEGAKPQELRQIEIEGPGTGLHWPALEIDHYVPALLGGVFGTRQWMSELGKKGGRARSSVKAAASRRNGRRGGRPRKRAAKRAA
jgi:Protein of unknown function (DUF2442)